MAREIICRLYYPSDANGAEMLAQIKSRLLTTSIANVGTPGVSQSYVRMEDETGTLVEMQHIDRFGHVRDGEPGNSDTPPTWQPSVGGRSYGALDLLGEPTRVTHNGAVWLNSHGDGNVWEPGVFGWTQQ